MTRGGTHDVAREISTRVFTRPSPYAFAYEFLLFGGKKMSTSHADCMPAREILEILRPELARFLIVRPVPRKQVEFDPRGETIPALYDEYDRAAAAYFHDTENPDLARTFYFSRVDGEQPRCYRPRFIKIAYLLQIPSVDLPRAVALEKGAPLDDADRVELDLRVTDARRWLATYAPDHYKFQVQASLPETVSALTPAQRRYLARVAETFAGRRWTGEDLHARLHALKDELGLTAREAFEAIYLAFLGKDSGPQAGWFLASLDPDFVLGRLREGAQDAA
jgi:lysyl-tRNA synthetase class 1